MIEAAGMKSTLRAAVNIRQTHEEMDSPHIIPLSSQAIEVLELLRLLIGDELLFPGDGNWSYRCPMRPS